MHAATGEGMGSMKSQFKRADASGARFALVFGPDELSRNEVAVKSLRDGSMQLIRSLDNIPHWAATLQSAT
jgi:histidyl-tRNA synthetase